MKNISHPPPAKKRMERESRHRPSARHRLRRAAGLPACVSATRKHGAGSAFVFLEGWGGKLSTLRELRAKRFPPHPNEPTHPLEKRDRKSLTLDFFGDEGNESPPPTRGRAEGTRKQAPTIRAASTPESSRAARLRLSNTDARCWICFRVPRRMNRETFHSPRAPGRKIPDSSERAHPPA